MSIVDVDTLPADRRIVSSGCGCKSIPSMLMGSPCERRSHIRGFPMLFIVPTLLLIRWHTSYIEPEPNIILGYN